MLNKNRWLVCLCVFGMLCGVLCACGDVRPTQSETSAVSTTTSTTATSTTTTTTTTTTIATTTTTEKRSPATTTTTAKPVPAYLHPTASRRKCYVNYLGERVLVSHIETVWKKTHEIPHNKTTHQWVYEGQLADGNTLICRVDAKTEKILQMGSGSPYKPGWIKEETAVEVALKGFKKWGFDYTKEDVSVDSVTCRKTHPDEPLSNFYTIGGGTKESYISITVRLTGAGVQIVGASFHGEQPQPEWVTA